MRKTGLVSISFRPLTVPELIAAAKGAGLKAIEWGSDVHAPFGDTEKLSAVAQMTADAGLSVSSYGSYFRVGVTENGEFPAYIRAAKTLGTNIIRVWAGDRSFDDYTADDRTLFRDTCRRLADIAAENGVTMAFECHHGTYTDCLSGALDLMDGVASPACRMYWQPNQYKTTEENIAYARAIAPMTVMLHVFAWDAAHRYPLSEHAALWKTYFAAFPENIPALLEFMPDDRAESLPREAEALRDILKGE